MDHEPRFKEDGQYNLRNLYDGNSIDVEQLRKPQKRTATQWTVRAIACIGIVGLLYAVLVKCLE